MFVPCILLLFFNLFIMMYYILWVCYCFRKWICLYLVYFFFSLIFFCSSWCIIASGSGYVCTLFTSSFLYFSFVHHDVLSRQEVNMFVPCFLLLFSYFRWFIMMYYRVKKWICLYLVYFFFSLFFFCLSWCIIASRSGYVCTLFTSSVLLFSFVHHDVLSRQEVDVFVSCLLLLFSYLFIMMYYRARK